MVFAHRAPWTAGWQLSKQRHGSGGTGIEILEFEFPDRPFQIPNKNCRSFAFQK